MISALFDGIEKLINEHGSAAILRERIVLLKEQFAALESQLIVCRNESITLKEKISQLQTENENLKLKYNTLNEQVENLHSSNPNGYRCDHCDSRELKKTGSKLDPTFGRFGVKNAFFTCLDCGKESVFKVDPPK